MSNQITLTVTGDLISEAQQLGQHDNELEAVLAALQAYIQRLKQQQIIEMFGTVEYETDYDYKKQRQAT